MSWHASGDRIKDDGKLRHPSNGKQWKDFDATSKEFGSGKTDGMNLLPKQPSNDIDVFLEPFMEDMKILWEDGIKMMDASRKEKFTLKAIIFVTITDYLGLFSLSGQIKGKTGCVVCIDGTCYTYLKRSSKMVYTKHIRFLIKKHRYRKVR
jgi:hypothetical protein